MLWCMFFRVLVNGLGGPSRSLWSRNFFKNEQNWIWSLGKIAPLKNFYERRQIKTVCQLLILWKKILIWNTYLNYTSLHFKSIFSCIHICRKYLRMKWLMSLGRYMIHWTWIFKDLPLIVKGCEFTKHIKSARMFFLLFFFCRSRLKNKLKIRFDQVQT